MLPMKRRRPFAASRREVVAHASKTCVSLEIQVSRIGSTAITIVDASTRHTNSVGAVTDEKNADAGVGIDARAVPLQFSCTYHDVSPLLRLSTQLYIEYFT